MNEFALELGIAEAFFSSLASPDKTYQPLSEVEIMSADLITRASEAGGAIFPDGLAVLGKQETVGPVNISHWDPEAGQIKARSYPTLESRIDEPLYAAHQGWFLEEQNEDVEPAVILLPNK